MNGVLTDNGIDKGNWTISGSTLTFKINNGYATYVGEITNSTLIKGWAKNINGKRWAFELTLLSDSMLQSTQVNISGYIYSEEPDYYQLLKQNPSWQEQLIVEHQALDRRLNKAPIARHNNFTPDQNIRFAISKENGTYGYYAMWQYHPKKSFSGC